MSSSQRKNSKQLLSLRNSEVVPGKQYTDETVNISVVKTEASNSSITVGSTNEIDVGNKPYTTSVIFEPLGEECETYLKEVLCLPPIDLSAMPKKYYINPHPTESIMSGNSLDKLWEEVDYSDGGSVEVECAGCSGRTNKRGGKCQEKYNQVVADTLEPAVMKFPRTLEMQRERQVRELQEEKAKREEVISKLESQMVSLYNLKRQYKKTLFGEGCPRVKTLLPPLVGGGGDKLSRQRDSLICRIKRKKQEEEVKRKKQIERKIYIIKTILNEQKQKERELKMKIKNALQLNNAKQKKTKKTPSDLFLGSENKYPDIERPSSLNESPSNDDFIPYENSLIEDFELDIQHVPTEVPLTSDIKEEQEQQSPKQSLKKSSKTVRKKSGKQGRKTSPKKNKIAKVSQETPAICSPPAELPTSQLTELSLWFENWRENMAEHNQSIQDDDPSAFPEEKEVLLKPPNIVFKDMEAGKCVQQVTTITNTGMQPLQCRVVGVQLLSCTGTSPVLQAELSGPSRARTGQMWSLTVTLDVLEGVGDGTAEVVMLLSRGKVRTRLSVGVQLLMSRAEPTLSTNCVRFGPQMHWCDNPVIKNIQISNPGRLGCLVYWTRTDEAGQSNLMVDTHSNSEESQIYTENLSNSFESNVDEDVTDSWEIVKYILDIVFQNVFSTFRIDERQPLALHPGSQVALPIKFVPAFSQDLGDVFTKYKFYFQGEKVDNEIQDLTILGRIEQSPFRLDQDVVNLQLCYIGGSVQQAGLVVHSSARHALHVVARVPRTLASVVSVVPRSAVVAANSFVTLVVRLVLGWDFLDKPCRYLDPDCGLLMFPVKVWVSEAGAPLAVEAPPLEATVIASVVPPCPLTLTPSIVDLGVVTTMETVEAELLLTNHWACPYSFGFLDLPPSVMIEPGGGAGDVLPLETMKLKLLFSPQAQDLNMKCGRPGGEGTITFTLRCFTTISLASPIQIKYPQKYQLTGQEVTINQSRVSSNHSVSLQSSKLSFEEKNEENKNMTKDVQEDDVEYVEKEPLTKVSLNEQHSIEELSKEGIEEDKDDDEDCMTISEVKEESQELAAEVLWDYYSKFNFCKRPNENKHTRSTNSEIETEAVKENGEVPLRNKSDLSVDVEKKSGETLETNINNNPQSDQEDHLHEDPMEENTTVEETVSHTNNPGNSTNATEENYFSIDEDEHISEKDTDESSTEKKCTDMKLLPEMSQRFITLSVKAYIVDPLVELSSQTVILPPTPCTSYTVAYIYLRARSQEPCCVHKKITKFKTKFEFKSPSTHLRVEPRCGYIAYKQSKKISLIYTPSLDAKHVYDKALEMKMDSMKWKKIQDLLNEYYAAKVKKQSKGKKGSKETTRDKNSRNTSSMSDANSRKSSKGKAKKSEGTVVSVKTKKTKGSIKSSKLKKKSSGPLPDVFIDPAEVTVTEEDIKNAEMAILKYLEPYKEKLTLLCLLETLVGEDDRRQEVLRCDVMCSVLAPVIFLDSPVCMDFGPVAVGSCSRMEARIVNISFFDALVSISTLNPVGPFMCPAHLEYPFWKNGMLELPPEHILRVPLRFQPTHSSEVVEAFEILSNPTVIHLQARGRGVLPSFTFQPGQKMFIVQVVEAFEILSDPTVIHLQARGRGVLPSFTFQPGQEVFMVSSAAGKKADIAISILNTCEASLMFSIQLDYIKEGQSLPSPKAMEAQTAPNSPKQKKDSKKGNKCGSFPQFSVLSEELENSLEHDFVTVKTEECTEPVFKLLNSETNFTVPAEETKQIIVRFSPPLRDKQGIESPRSAKLSSKGQRKSKGKTDDQDISIIKTQSSKTKKNSKLPKSEKKELDSVKNEKTENVKKKQIYAARFRVVLAETKVKDWVLIGTNKK